MTSENTPETRSFLVSRHQVSLYKSIGGDSPSESLMEMVSISKEILPAGDGQSAQGVNKGRRPHPFDFDVLKLLKDYNEHHATCIHAKTSATVGLGYLNEAEKAKRSTPPPPPVAPQPTPSPSSSDPAGNPAPVAPAPAPVMPDPLPIYEQAKADKILDPLTSISWHDVQMDACEDYWDTGNGYIEVVRRGGTIKGLHYLPARDVYICVDDDKHNFHYVISGEGVSTERHFAAFGDKDDFIARMSKDGMESLNPDDVSEIIHLRRPSSRSKWYGTSDWISAVPMIELAQMLHQYKFDFFNNRGVPEFMLFITGAVVGDDDWKAIEDSIKANIGLGNSHKSVAINLPQKDIVIQIEKLAIEGKSDEDFKTLKETIALSVVTAHKVPPLLAGIQIPGKLGATNELSQALIAFQALVIGQAQRLFQATFARTLGSDGAGLGLVGEDFTYKTVTDELDPQKLDTIGRMHEPLPIANAKGRDIGAGVKN